MAFDPDPELAALLEQLPNPHLKVIDPGLERTEALLAALDNPHHKLPPVIHIAGTNGKGSTLALMQAMLEAAGKRVHKYTSPHLVSFCERIVLAGQPITKAQLMPILKRIQDLQNECPSTFFEATTVAALVAFSETPADVVLLETGLGGRLDSTNILEQPLAAIITPIGLDHQDYLGNTLAEIAGEKAGILRASVPAFIANQELEALAAITAKSADFHLAGEAWSYEIISGERWEFIQGDERWKMPMPRLEGEHQVGNAALAIACLRHTHPEITPCQMAEGLQAAQWPARLQRITHPNVPAALPLYLDGAHNAMAGRELAKWAEKLPHKPVLVLAMKFDKDAAAFIEIWQNKAERIIATIIPDETEYVAPELLCEICQEFDIKCEIENDASVALTMAASHKRPIIICGSLYLAGAILAKN
ncbi:MAG: bifunctional folylpolyglutamate synthase/dihydrofolate synthase [Rickettsiales bacterium]|nr:bifunctional folylpolyglutamate synthase/dihydrofolate synthase [Rickettsiales bacterium]